MSYKQAKDEGKNGEDFIEKLLRNAGIANSPNEAKGRNKLIEWDIRASLGGREFTLEVKHDIMQAKTGNVAVEFYNTKLDKPSGIDATTSDLWVFVFQPFSAFVARTKDLKEFVNSVKPHRIVVSGGDNNASLKLYHRDVILLSVFHPMDDLTPPELRGLLKELLCA